MKTSTAFSSCIRPILPNQVEVSTKLIAIIRKDPPWSYQMSVTYKMLDLQVRRSRGLLQASGQSGAGARCSRSGRKVALCRTPPSRAHAHPAEA
eukprot:5052506-Pyramimonas_sp.AAC.1